MLISEILEKTQQMSAAENMANRLADRDFVIGPVREESEKREVNRKEFRRAFAQWEQLYNSRKV